MTILSLRVATVIALSATTSLLATSAAAQRGSWNSAFGQGNMEYLGGRWDAAIGSALLLNCDARNNTASLSLQIAGKTPPPGTTVSLAISPRSATRTLRFRTGAQGSVDFGPAASSRPVRQLWSALRSGDTVTIRYADGRSGVQSLTGAALTLPVRPCG